MPGGTARLRVSGAITRRLGGVIGPSLKGLNSLVWLMSGMSALDDDREQLGIGGNCAIPEPFGLRRVAAPDPGRVGGFEPWRRVRGRRMIHSKSGATRQKRSPGRRPGGRTAPSAQ